jgi:hypothetical protein
MLSNELFESFFCPLGLKAKILDEEEEENFKALTVHLTGTNGRGNLMDLTIELCLPIPDKRYGRILTIEASGGTRYRVVCHKAFKNPLDMTTAQTEELCVRTWRGTVIDAMNDIVSETLLDTYFEGQDPSIQIIEQRMNTWFKTSPHILDVDPDKPMQVKSACQAVVIDIIDEPMSHNSRIFPESWIGSLDPCSTPTSNKINAVYRLSHGSTIEANTIIPSGHIFCSTIYENAIGLSMLPRRAYLLRTTFENSERLLMEEEPRIAGPNCTLSGVHLHTAIMHLDGITFEDCIAISESAAAKLSCSVFKRETAKSMVPLHSSISEGDVLGRGDIMAEDDSEEQFRTNKIYSKSIVTEVEQGRSMIHGQMGYYVRAIMSAVYPLQNGDKLSNRAAGKGVVRIIPDKEMPLDNQGHRIDVCVGPESVYGRRSILTYWEMMAHAHQDAGGEITVDILDPTPDFTELSEKYGEKIQLFLKGHQLPELTFVGTVFWSRINKHAREAFSCKGNKEITNQYNLRSDDARLSGQRIDLAKMIALRSRNMNHIMTKITRSNTQGITRLRDLLGVLVDAERLDDWNKHEDEAGALEA